MTVKKLNFVFSIVCIALIVGCSVSKEPTRTASVIDHSESGQAVMKTRPDPQNTAAIDRLMKDARVWRDKGQYTRSVASLERALRIAPRNPHVWSQLAQVRFSQKQYRQAESLALRSNQYVGPDTKLRRFNWRLIAYARDKLGNKSGAKAARLKANN